ncbi:MAG: SDR family oxidoreductase [Sphingobacteriales bacterium]|jgi:enoyl-[acyl-carrier protein] reductase I|nr:SDR family oxidoreductase [Sphingobacteriales bacterium]
MNNLLKGKKGIIFGALNDKSIAWQVALKCNEQGAEFVLTNAPIAMRMGEINKLAEVCNNAKIIACDVSKNEDMENLISQSMEILGGKIDFILHSVGMSLNIRKGRTYTDLDYKWTHETYDISSMSFHRLLQTCYKMDAINDWGSVVALSYIAAQRVFPDYNEMADAKALLESVARSFGYHYGKAKKVRVNTISQSPTPTTAGSGVKGFGDFFDYASALSPLGNASAEACADYCVLMFSDLSRMVTMQNLFHDGGFSNTGFSYDVFKMMDKTEE